MRTQRIENENDRSARLIVGYATADWVRNCSQLLSNDLNPADF